MKQFYQHLEKHFRNNLDGITPLQKAIREKAWHRFSELGLADKKSAGYEYFPLSQFYRESYDLAGTPDFPHDKLEAVIHPECLRSYVVFFNGRYSPANSDISGLPEGVVVSRLIDALLNYGSFLQGRLSKTLKEETDPFATLNLALVQMGLFIYVPPKVEVECPLQCIHLISHDRPAMFHPRIQFFLGKQSKLKWLFDHHCVKDFEYFTNTVLDIALEEGARFEQYGMMSPYPNGWCFAALRVTQKRDSHFKSVSCTTGAKAVRHDFRISLMQENASCDLKGIALLDGDKQAHTNILIDHQAPHCQSHQLFKNVLAGNSRSSFEGKIFVHPKAQKTEAYQLNNNLLLGDRPIANSKPHLEIFADDVKASHGVTVTQLNPEHLLYLKTRGISPHIGKKLLLQGFIQDVIEDNPFISSKERMQQLAERFSQ